MKFNKIVACAAAVACSVSMFGAMSISAADSNFTISAGSAEIKAAQNFTVDINVTNVPTSGIAGLDFAIKYDSSAIKVNSVAEGAASKTNDLQPEGLSSNLSTNITNGEIDIIWATGQIKTNDSWIKKDGVLLTLDCTALTLKEGDSTSIEIVPVSRKGSSIDAVGDGLKVFSPQVSAGKVAISSGESDLLYGDVTEDNVVDITDLTTLGLYLLEDKKFSDIQMKKADVVLNGSVDLADLATLKQYIMKDPIKLGVPA